MERWVTKLIVMGLLFVIPLVCTVLPLKVFHIFESKGKKGREVLGWLMCFGGGVFFATYILHMVPEVQEILNEALIEPENIDYPLAELIMACGFFLVLSIEILVMDRNKQAMKKNRSLDDIEKNKQVNNHDDSTEVHNDARDMKGITYENSGDAHHVPRSFILMIALSLHHLFEGIAVGLKTTEHDVWSMFIAVICHEAVISFSLGLQLVKNKFSLKRFLFYAVSCSLVLPIGIGIGTLLTEVEDGSSRTLDIVNGVMQALATGSFIYVTFFEILSEEINHMSATKSRLGFLLVGFAAMALMGLIPEDTEEHHDTVLTNTTLSDA